MQETTNKRLLLLLVVLIGATVAVSWWGGKDRAFDVNKDLFRSFDLKAVDHVLLESPAGKVTLAYNGSRWMVNDRYRADADMIDVLFATLQQAEPKRPLNASLQDSVGAVLEQKGVRVTLSSQGNVLEKFYAGGNSAKTQAYFKKEGATESYLMAIPGYRVYVSGIFELAEGGWRDKYVFNFNWRNFKRLEAKFRDRANDFAVVLDDENFPAIEGVAAADTARLNSFLDAVSLLTVDEYAQTEKPDTSVSDSPLVSFTIQDIADKEYSLKVFPGTPGQFVGIVGDSQRVIFAEKKIRPIIRPKSFFLKQ